MPSTQARFLESVKKTAGERASDEDRPDGGTTVADRSAYWAGRCLRTPARSSTSTGSRRSREPSRRSPPPCCCPRSALPAPSSAPPSAAWSPPSAVRSTARAWSAAANAWSRCRPSPGAGSGPTRPGRRRERVVVAVGPAAPGWRERLAMLPWKRISLVAAALFAATLVTITAFEIAAGKPVSSMTGGSDGDGRTTLCRLGGGSGGGSSTEDDKAPTDGTSPSGEPSSVSSDSASPTGESTGVPSVSPPGSSRCRRPLPPPRPPPLPHPPPPRPPGSRRRRPPSPRRRRRTADLGPDRQRTAGRA